MEPEDKLGAVYSHKLPERLLIVCHNVLHLTLSMFRCPTQEAG